MTTEPNPIVPVAPILTPKRRSSGGATNLVLALAALVAVGGVAFAGGRATAPASASSGNQRAAFAGGVAGYGPTGSFVPGQGGFGNRTETLSGTVTAVDGTKLTIKTASGSTVTVDTASATYHQQAAATSSDVATGTTVQVSVTGGGFPGGPGGPNASAAPAASGGAAAGSTTLTASDVTITTK